VLSDMRSLVGDNPLPEVSLRAFCTGWLQTKKAEVKPATYEFYSGSCTKFLLHLGELADSGNLSALTKELLLSYRTSLSRLVGPRTVNHHLVVIRMLCKAARRDGLIADDPSEFVGSVKREDTSSKRRAFTVAELEPLIETADPEWRSMILFGLYTGQRLRDVATLSWANIDLARGELRMVAAKTGTRLILPLAAPLRAHIESLTGSDDPAGYLHPRAAQAKTSARLSYEFSKLLIQAGLQQKPHSRTAAEHTERHVLHELSFHSLRHTTVSLLHESGVAQATAQAFVGHSSAEVQQRYVHVGRDVLQQAANSLPVISRGKD
jgi:integrase